ncbi:MAG: hypothetical protein CMH57_00555 [Myxococcales bacterium]|nr:hypothetical protein [Myxococcales bacterium]
MLLALCACLALTGCPSGGDGGGKKDNGKATKDDGKKGDKKGGDKKGDAKKDDTGGGNEATGKPQKIKPAPDDATVEFPVPNPALVFDTLSILGKPDWGSLVTDVEKSEYSSEDQAALVTGVLLADFFVHIYAKDGDKALATIDQIKSVSAPLKAGWPKDEVASLKKSIKGKKWDEANGEIELIQSIMTAEMEKQRRKDLIMLVSLGSYLEGTYVATQIVGKDYSKKTAAVLQQSELLSEVKKTKKLLGDDSEHINCIFSAMEEIEKLMKTDDGEAISKENVEKIGEIAKTTKGKIVG